MVGSLLVGLVLIAWLYCVIRAGQGMYSRYGSVVPGGSAERKARAEYGRIKRETPDSQDARITEAEFVNNYIKNHIKQGPNPWKYGIVSILLLLIGVPVSCGLM